MERAIPILPGDDLEAMKRFYVDGLGFEVTFEARYDAGGMFGAKLGTIELTIDCPMPGHGRLACASLRVDDADAYYIKWTTRGVSIEREPRNEEWGSRTFSVHDPAGNTLFVMGPIKL